MTTNDNPLVSRTERHDEDGKPYLAYFDAPSVMGFLWDGDPDHPVQVQREMGEPIIATFYLDPQDMAGQHKATGWLVLFRSGCQRFLREYGFGID